jgi:hypothetical protein
MKTKAFAINILALRAALIVSLLATIAISNM